MVVGREESFNGCGHICPRILSESKFVICKIHSSSILGTCYKILSRYLRGFSKCMHFLCMLFTPEPLVSNHIALPKLKIDHCSYKKRKSRHGEKKTMSKNTPRERAVGGTGPERERVGSG